MRIQFNLPAWFLLVAVAAIVAYRFSPNDRMDHRFLERFATSHAHVPQTLIEAHAYKQNGVQRFAFVFGERTGRMSIGRHFVVVTDDSLLPIAWRSFADDCELSLFKVNEHGEIVLNRLYPTGSRRVATYQVREHALRDKKPVQFTMRFPTDFITEDDYEAYRRLGDRRDGAPLRNWGNR